MRLFAFLRPDRGLVDHLSALETRVGELAADNARLNNRLAELESAQHPARLMEWVELREQLARYLARINTVEQRMKQRENGESSPTAPVPLAEVLRAKYPRIREG